MAIFVTKLFNIVRLDIIPIKVNKAMIAIMQLQGSILEISIQSRKI